MCSGPNATSSNTVGLNSWSSGSWNTRPDLGPDPAHGRAVDDGVADADRPVGRLVDAVEVQHQRALAGAVRTDQRHLLARADREVEPLQRLEPVRVAEVEVLDRHRGRRAGAALLVAVRVLVVDVVVPVGVRVLVDVVGRRGLPRIDGRHSTGPTPGPRPRTRRSPAGSARAPRTPSAPGPGCGDGGTRPRSRAPASPRRSARSARTSEGTASRPSSP